MHLSSRLPAVVRCGARLAAGALLMSSLLACGYKGPLYLPEPEAPPAELTAPPGHQTPSASHTQ